jgi:pimeloyl-ACP methyl ester carboxylesterase
MSTMYQSQWQAREDRIELRGLTHRVLRWESTESRVDLPIVVLLHGFQDCSDTYQFLVDALPRQWRFIGLDWRGFGGSDWQHGPYWFADYLADLDALLEQLSPAEPVRLIGHSMGGNIAGLYAGIRPNRVRYLVSLEGFGLRRAAADTAPQRYREWLDQVRQGPRLSRHESVPHLAAALLRRNPRLDPAIAAFVANAWIRPDATDGNPALHFDPWHRLLNPVLYRREEAEACWRDICAPVLIALGKESEYRERLESDGDLARFIQCFRNAEVADFDGLGHMLHHEAPVVVAQRLASWMQRQDVATDAGFATLESQS